MRTLIRGATVLTMADTASRPEVMDVLVENTRIARLGHNLDAPGAEVVDGHGRLLLPGLVNAHIHSWQSAFRGIACNWNLLEYLGNMHFRLAPHYTAEDIYYGTLWGALNQIACGTTTLADWCHNNTTPEHTDAGLRALEDAGIRALFLPAAPRRAGPDDTRHPADVMFPRSEIERLLQVSALARNDPLIRLGMAVHGGHYSPAEVAIADFRLAKEFGLVISMHHSGGPARNPETWEKLDQEGLLGLNVNIVHGNRIPDDLLGRFVERGVSFTVTPEVEMGDGHGQPITGRLRDLGALPSLGVDIESAISGEMLLVARMALAHQRMLDHDRRQQSPEEIAPLTARDALAWATLGGARALGLEHEIGSLEPGKQADLVLIDTRAMNLWPVHDPYASALQASLANIEAVMIAGAWQKRHGRLCYGPLDAAQGAISASARRIALASGLESAVTD